jgi:hypothetical protein
MSQAQSHQMASSRDRELPLALREAPITEIRADKRTIDVVWTAGAKIERYDWFSEKRYVEELVISDAAVRLATLNAGAPVLDSHNRYAGLASMLAVVEHAWLEGGKGMATIRFPKEGIDPDIDRTFGKIADRMITKLSCGYRRHKIEVDKAKSPEVWRVIDWEPFEISFVTIPADPETGLRSGSKSHADLEKYRCEFVAPPPNAGARLARMRMRNRAAGIIG